MWEVTYKVPNGLRVSQIFGDLESVVSQLRQQNIMPWDVIKLELVPERTQ